MKTRHVINFVDYDQETLFSFFPVIVVGIIAFVIGQDLQEIPTDLNFSCDGRAYGYYADPTTNCQVFHICLGDGDIKWSFLCPNQTIFNQVNFWKILYFIGNNFPVILDSLSWRLHCKELHRKFSEKKQCSDVVKYDY